MMASNSLEPAKRSSDSALMPPPPPPKRQKRPASVLGEDVYADAVSHIIARDFFPGLMENNAQEEYMDALDSNNKDWIREAGRNLTQVMTPGPDSRRLSNNKPDVDVNMSLGAFQTKYTSEDNESFNALIDQQNEKRAAKYGFLHHGNKILTARQIAWREKEQQRLENGESSSTALVKANDDGKPPRPSQDLDARPASVDSFPTRQGPRNHFMFGPEGVEDVFLTRAQKAGLDSVAPPKAVNYSGTRFPDFRQEEEKPIPPSPSINAIDAAIAGRPRATGSEPGYSGAETPRVNGYAFVDAEPSPREVGMLVTNEEADAAEQEAAKQFLPKLDENGISRFRIEEQSRRETLHHKLVEKAVAGRRKVGNRLDQLRNLGITPARTPTPKFASGANIRKGDGMTPATRSLADRLSTPRDVGMFGSSRKQGNWTPTARTKRGA